MLHLGLASHDAMFRVVVVVVVTKWPDHARNLRPEGNYDSTSSPAVFSRAAENRD